MWRTIAVALLLTSCGAAASSPELSTAPPTPAQTVPATAGTTADVAPSTTVGKTADSDSGFPARLALRTNDGHVITFSEGRDPVDTPGVMGPSGEVVISSDTIGDRSTIEWHSVGTDEIFASIQVDGEVRPTAISEDGNLVALIGIVGKQTTVVLATPKGEMRRWTFDALLVPEAFANAYVPEGDGLPIGVFVIEYLAADTYRVRVIDTATGELGLPLNLRDKSQTVDEVMTAVSRTAVFEPVNQLLFTLYQDATEGGENIGSFIHTLGLINGVWCLDVPAELGLADNPGALAVSPDGSRLFAASSIGGVAGYDVSDITAAGPVMPEARTTTSVGASAQRVAIGASQAEVVLALGGSVFRLDPATLAVRESFTWDMDVEALTVLQDGRMVIVGSRRMSLVSADNQLLDETPIGEIGEVIRVVVVG